MVFSTLRLLSSILYILLHINSFVWPLLSRARLLDVIKKKSIDEVVFYDSFILCEALTHLTRH